jgi:hypothetical protein
MPAKELSTLLLSISVMFFNPKQLKCHKGSALNPKKN